MQTVHSVKELRSDIRQWRNHGEQIALVPTMGNLHDGHMSLIRHAKSRAERVVVSLFVNPMQFNDQDDFAAYPSTLKEDSYKLAESGISLLFNPGVAEMYPNGMETGTRVEVPGLSTILCGEFRPGHFVGVATVVAKLFNMVQPDIALFGEKDYQQLLVIQRMVNDLCMPVRIVGVETVREQDGLAMSSRNAYLSEQERRRAPVLYRALCRARDSLCEGNRDFVAIQRAGMAELAEAGFRAEYFTVRQSESLLAPVPSDKSLVILAAAWLGQARLIDNIPMLLKK